MAAAKIQGIAIYKVTPIDTNLFELYELDLCGSNKLVSILKTV